MGARLPSCTARDVERVLLQIGFALDRQRGSHKVFAHADGRTIVVPAHSRDLKRGTLLGIVKATGLRPDEFAEKL